MTADLAARAQLPSHLSGVLAALPKDTHPMVQLSTAVLALQVRPRLAPPSPLYLDVAAHVWLPHTASMVWSVWPAMRSSVAVWARVQWQ